ncbi:biogenesis of lysosome-related organelles complex 1 subunit 2 isoform X1 [Chlorocebus sabaeus]|uniref:biogenesis of lysosome-related organelles complex 1 subunit 2 isoform X1 n=1 Tax=Chlorocebus sabaeus TaxID=60711 RepID=UPI003BF9DC25
MAAAAEGVLATRRDEPARDDAAVETAEEAKEPAEADITELCRDMFSKMATYLTGELTATSEDYKLLENMNKLTSLKYLEMKDIAINISRNLKDLNQKYAGLQPYLDQINVIEEQVAALEQAAYKLDAYSKKLDGFHSCYRSWSAMVRSRLTATSTSWVQAILLPQPRRVAGITGAPPCPANFVFLVETGFLHVVRLVSISQAQVICLPRPGLYCVFYLLNNL